jgi:hypothetical protein
MFCHVCECYKHKDDIEVFNECNLCERCIEDYFESSPNFSNLQYVSLPTTYYFARYKQQEYGFNSFFKLAQFILKPNSMQYLATFGHVSAVCMCHMTREQAEDQLRELGITTMTLMWYGISKKNCTNTILKPKANLNKVVKRLEKRKEFLQIK